MFYGVEMFNWVNADSRRVGESLHVTREVQCSKVNEMCGSEQDSWRRFVCAVGIHDFFLRKSLTCAPPPDTIPDWYFSRLLDFICILATVCYLSYFSLCIRNGHFELSVEASIEHHLPTASKTVLQGVECQTARAQVVTR